MNSVLRDNTQRTPIQELYDLQLLTFEEEKTENGVVAILADSVNNRILEVVGEILDEDDSPYRFVFIRSKTRLGAAMIVVDQTDLDEPEILFYDCWYWGFIFVFLLTQMFQEAIEWH